jgi:crotonobetainyl-CoA:carnitine CoA-transferase CaiB-like acyl-CoA transferase
VTSSVLGGGPAKGPLDGLIVADFSRIVAGPYCTMQLGDLGADVIKVESPAGDDTRTFVPPTFQDESTYYLSINRNKRSIALDFTDPVDLVAAQELARRADVVVHNFMPGRLERFGLGYGDVSQTNPGVVYCAISGFGTKGGASMPGYDLLIQAVSGLMYQTGEADGEPMRAGMAAFDVLTGLHASVAILAALSHRTATGQGQLIELDLLTTALASMFNQTSAYVAGDVIPRRMGNEHPSLYPYGPFPTGDGDLIVVAGNDRQFRTLCEAIGQPELAADPLYATVGQRNANRASLGPQLITALSSRTAQEWAEILGAAGLPCGPVNDVRGGVELATRLGLEPVVDVEGVPMVKNPVTYSVTPVSYRRRPPRLDDEGTQIRAWLAADHETEPIDA